MTKSLRAKLKAAVLACAIADAVLLIWLLSPRAPSVAARQQELESTRAELIALRAESAQLKLLRQRVSTGQREIQVLMAQGIPRQAEASSKLLNEFQRLASASQVQISGAEFDPEQKAQLGLRKVAISLQVAGGYAGVVRFLNQLERSNMFFLINQVSVSGGSGGNPAPGGSIKLQVQLEAYEQI